MSVSENIKVTIVLRTPMVVPKDLLHLDAVLGAIKVGQAKAAIGDGINPRDYHYDLPLERFEGGNGQWVFKASALRLKAEAPQNFMQTSRINLSDAAEHRDNGWLNIRANIPNIAGGPFKTSIYHVPLAFGELTGYCVGNKDRIQEMLESCKQIGGRRGTGWGCIKSVTVETVGSEECDWMDRNLPADTAGAENSHALGVSNLHAPYWDRTLYEKVLIPTK